MRGLLVLTLALAALAKDSDFNGRWNIQVDNDARRRAWWLEVTGAGSVKPAGKFISALRGDLNVIENLSIKDGLLRFSFQRPANQKQNAPAAKLVYEAKLVNGGLAGEHFVEGSKQRTKFWGKRAPEIREKDDTSWKRGKPVDLFNGTDLSNWSAMVPGKDLGWKVEGGIMKNVAGANNLVSAEKFWNFELHCEFKIGAHSNGGFGLRGRYEIQIVDDFGKPPGTRGTGALYSRIAPSVNASKAPGEWQSYDIRLVGRTVTVTVNGKKVIDKGIVEGLTAMAHDWDEAVPGPLSVQGDHGPVEIRKLTITPLTR
ncbi:MAG: DUF1080 domain-containing protein [Acidobacteria bacterium]|nr:DUF1080 domain-containing protein [Acidobacteriota bacterium]